MKEDNKSITMKHLEDEIWKYKRAKQKGNNEAMREHALGAILIHKTMRLNGWMWLALSVTSDEEFEMNTMNQVSKEHPLMKAWEAHKKTEEYAHDHELQKDALYAYT